MLRKRRTNRVSAPTAAQQAGPLAVHSALNPQSTGAHYNPVAPAVPGGGPFTADPDAMIGQPDDTMNAGGSP
jgi:hypothetical protein